MKLFLFMMKNLTKYQSSGLLYYNYFWNTSKMASYYVSQSSIALVVCSNIVLQSDCFKSDQDF